MTSPTPCDGRKRVWTRLYSKRVGKTVLHCHFLAHEETTMIQNFLIKPSAIAGQSQSSPNN